MTTNYEPKGYLLHATAHAGRQPDAAFNEQRRLLSAVATYDPGSQTWHSYIGALDEAGLKVLNTMFAVAGRFNATLEVAVESASAHWTGPVLQQIGADLVAAQAKQADAGRKLGQVVR